MTVSDANLPWTSSEWRERNDSVWQRTLRLQQSWWRQTRTGMAAGPSTGGTRLVSSMLPVGTEWSPNLMTPAAVASARRARLDLETERRPGIIQIDRLHRNLLSSQPLCFNLFGHLSAEPSTLLEWVRTFHHDAESVDCVRLEWAPLTGNTGGSAFDAFVTYTRSGGARGFLGIECKYAENLTKAQPRPAPEKFKVETVNGPWREGAETRLDRPSLRQFWYNQLLTQRVAAGDFTSGIGVVVACHDDNPARRAVEAVRTELDDPSSLRFSSINDVIDAVPGHERWRRAFTERYLTYDQIPARLAQDNEPPGRQSADPAHVHRS
ncbi:PGN_0703 family putative restriction endonuclease [Nocardioides sp. NPDC101246]|uniref:PGN_0703 family putative restriction endonuclease n=1 Tax=Nocardioides sp. NPDC101246 TaxID=3364336 RepID=UPI0037F89676